MTIFLSCVMSAIGPKQVDYQKILTRADMRFWAGFRVDPELTSDMLCLARCAVGRMQ